MKPSHVTNKSRVSSSNYEHQTQKIQKEGKEWSVMRNLDNYHNMSLRKQIKILKECAAKLPSSPEEIKKYYQDIKNLHYYLVLTNKQAHEHDKKLKGVFLSLFSVGSLDSEISNLERKISPIQTFIRISTLCKKLNEKIEKEADNRLISDVSMREIEVREAEGKTKATEGLFRVPGLDENINEFVAAFKENPDTDISSLDNAVVASSIKRFLKELIKDKDAMKSIQSTNIHVPNPENQLKPKATEKDKAVATAKAIEDASDAWKKLPAEEQELCKNLMELMSNVMKTPTWENSTTYAMLQGNQFIKEIFPNAEFLIDHYEEIFEK